MPKKTRKKIVHLITGLETGGAEMMLLKTLPLLQTEFENEVYCLKGKGIIGERLKEKGILVYYLHFNLVSLLITVWRFKKLLKSSQPDLLVLYLIHADIFGRIFGRIFGVKKIISNRRGFYLNWRSLYWLDRVTAPLVDRFIVQTEHAVKVLSEDLSVPKEKISVVPNAIDLKEYDFNLDSEEKKLSLGIPRENINITCVSTLKPGKGLEELLQAFNTLFSQNPHYSLLLVGDGPLKEELRKESSLLPASKNIFFLGRRFDVREILHISDIFVLPTYSEGMSNAILEAMASKLPVVSTTIPVNQEVIENMRTGLLIPVGDSHLLFKALQKLIEKPALRESLGDAAFQKVKNSYSLERIIRSTEKCYNQVLDHV